MKTIKNLFAAATLGCMAVMLISSCVKKANNYAPAKPLQPINGFYASNSVDAANLVAYWPFNGDLVDSISKTAGVATLTSFGKGIIGGQALQGANNGYVVSNVPQNVQNLHSFTISLWYNMPENTTGAVGLISIANNQTGGPGFWGSFDVFFDNGATPTTGNLTVHAFNVSGSAAGHDQFLAGIKVNNAFGVWANITTTYDDTTGTFIVYFNGTQVATATPTGFAPLNWTAAQQMVFGTLQFQTNPSLTADVQYPGFASFLIGEMNHVRVFNKVLSANDVGAIYGLEKLGR